MVVSSLEQLASSPPGQQDSSWDSQLSTSDTSSAVLDSSPSRVGTIVAVGRIRTKIRYLDKDQAVIITRNRFWPRLTAKDLPYLYLPIPDNKHFKIIWIWSASLVGRNSFFQKTLKKPKLIPNVQIILFWSATMVCKKKKYPNIAFTHWTIFVRLFQVICLFKINQLSTMQFYVLLFRFVTKMLESVRTTDPTYIAGSGFRIETKKMGSRYAKVNFSERWVTPEQVEGQRQRGRHQHLWSGRKYNL